MKTNSAPAEPSAAPGGEAPLRVSRREDGRPEIFASLQGEGPSCGRPSLFLRLALCNLRCSWCDTRYTWDFERYDYSREVMEMAPGETLAALETIGGDNLVVTGGEPLLQQAGLAPVLSAWKRPGRRIEVETNGTIAPEGALASLADQWNVSPKTANSGDPAERRLPPGPLRGFARDPRAWFKFVTVDAADLEEIEAVIARFDIPRGRVFLMAEGTDAQTLADRGRRLADLCVERGFRYSPRLQVTLWGGERGR